MSSVVITSAGRPPASISSVKQGVPVLPQLEGVSFFHMGRSL